LNGDIDSDLGLPVTPQTTQILHFVSPIISSYWMNVETSNLVCRLIVASPSLCTAYIQQTIPERGVVTSRDPF